MLLVEQNAVAALEVVSHAYLIENGRIVMGDTRRAMKANPDIQEFYLGGATGRRLPRHQALPPPQALAVMNPRDATSISPAALSAGLTQRRAGDDI